MSTDFSQREKECFDFLRRIPTKTPYVVIGGYAVTSYGFPRFSVDLDLTISKSELSFFKEHVQQSGFVFTKGKEDLAYAGRFERYEKNLVSIDLLINGVASRQTGYCYPFSYIFKHSHIRETSGWDPANTVKARIATKEMLLALKIHSMRTADKRDIIMLCYEKPNVFDIITHLKKGLRKQLQGHIDELRALLGSAALKDSLKGVYSIDEFIYKKTIKNCEQTLDELKTSLSGCAETGTA